MDFFSLTIPNKKEFVSAARLLATSVAGLSGFDVESIEDIRMAVGEACNNVVVHSHDSDKIDLEIELASDVMRISVVDSGAGFERHLADVIDPDKYEGSGLGLIIIDAVMDDVEIHSGHDNGTTITMTKKK